MIHSCDRKDCIPPDTFSMRFPRQEYWRGSKPCLSLKTNRGLFLRCTEWTHFQDGGPLADAPLGAAMFSTQQRSTPRPRETAQSLLTSLRPVERDCQSNPEHAQCQPSIRGGARGLTGSGSASRRVFFVFFFCGLCGEHFHTLFPRGFCGDFGWS